MAGRPRLAQIEQVLARVLAWDAPADAVVSRWLREHPKLGARDRAQVADAVFEVLRHLRRYQYYCVEATEPGNAAPAPLYRLALLGLAATLPGQTFTAQDQRWLHRVQQIKVDDLPLAIRHSVPDWLQTRLQPDSADLPAVLAALNQPAPLDVRINPLKSPLKNTPKKNVREAMLAYLRTQFPASHPQPTPYSPWGIRLQGHPAIQRTDVFLRGELEVQDEASQLVALLLAPRRGEIVIDWCAGAGGKTLLLGALMHNSGRLYALDSSAARLARMQPRLARSGLTNVVALTIAADTESDITRRLHGKAHRVLVDAPCSGLGTLRRHPDLKWRQTPQTLAQLRLTQTRVLEAAAACVMPGGRLVYATCSILEEENEAQVEAFLRTHPEFSLQHAGDILQKLLQTRWGVNITPVGSPRPLVGEGLGERMQHGAIALPDSPFLNLRPHLHQTDGFFAAVMQRSTTSKTTK